MSEFHIFFRLKYDSNSSALSFGDLSPNRA